MLDTLDAPIPAGETIEAAYRRKEQELGDLFAELPARDALALHRRLIQAGATDPLAARFGRLVGERRGRLLAFLADARRREALAVARRGTR